MLKQLFIVIFFGSFAFISCSHHTSGYYVYRNGQWKFETKRVGFQHRPGRVDHKQYADSEGLFIWPVPASKKVSSFFGQRKGRHHDGVDIPAVTGTNIVASRKGIVTFAGRMRGYGKVVILKHAGGYHTVYAHNNKNFVSKGKTVNQGEVIAQVGSTGRSSGPHLHFEIRRNNKVRNPAFYLARLQRYLAKK